MDMPWRGGGFRSNLVRILFKNTFLSRIVILLKKKTKKKRTPDNRLTVLANLTNLAFL
jgi:hypothetical protein